MTRRHIGGVVISLALGGFFIVSGLGKLVDVNSFAGTLDAYGLPSPATIPLSESLAGFVAFLPAILIPPLEILLGLGLLMRLKNKTLALVALLSLVVFTVGFAWAYLSQGVEECGCFGAFESLHTSPLASFLRNFVLIGLAGYLWRNPVREGTAGIRAWQPGLLYGVGAIAFALAGYSSLRPINSPEPAGPAVPAWDNYAVESTPLESVADFSSDSTYLVFVYSPACPHCQDTIENAKAYASSGAVDRVIGISSAAEGDIRAFEQIFDVDFRTYSVSADVIRGLTDRYPTSFYVSGGVVSHRQIGQLRSPHVFRRLVAESVE